MLPSESSAHLIIEERVALYIDGLNVMFRLRECGWEEFFDVGRFARMVAGNRLLVGVRYFRARPSIPPIKTEAQYWAEVGYLQKVDEQMLAAFGQYVRYGYMAKRWHGWEEKKTDVWLGTQMVYDAAANVFDTAILVTADSDLVPAVEFVRHLDRSVELIVLPRAKPDVSQLLAEVDLVRRARPSWFVSYQDSN